VHFVNFAAKLLVHTRRALSSTVINSHQEPVSGEACNPLDPYWIFLSFLRWRSFTVLGTKVAPFPWLMWGVAFTACIVFSFSYWSCFIAWWGGLVQAPILDQAGCVITACQHVFQMILKIATTC
jgi:hypothetical protein